MSASAGKALLLDSIDVSRKPRDDEIDVYGVTHKGNVRVENQDHFLLSSIYKHVEILSTSLSDLQRRPLGDERVAFLAMVADGVGGGEGGEEASATALQNALQYVVKSMDCYYRSDASETAFINALQETAEACHRAVLARAREEGVEGTMATTLTLWFGVWPWYYLLQVGDSRYYLWRDGVLTQVSRDQTIAEELVEKGVFTRAVASRSQFAHVLSSSIGGDQTMPVVTRLKADWHNVHLLCSDGLTKHVSDERIAERLANWTTARETAGLLLQDALDGGGTDNITIILGRVNPLERRHDTLDAGQGTRETD
ncbi:MAG TPA: protein phosphatase 2C domain-containing protein [Gemmatimonadaceae bacterium]|jgi:protein phosphatase|nr:protein phosphatase 2C domain-containing protein [Gemmatimonadaceae bacterium]